MLNKIMLCWTIAVCVLGEGSAVDFWQDTWLCDAPLANSIHFVPTSFTKVSELLLNLDWDWNKVEQDCPPGVCDMLRSSDTVFII